MKKTTDLCNLKSCFLCRRCLDDWIPAIDAHKRNFSFRKGAKIFKEGDPVEGIYFLYQGVVKVHQRWGTDKDLILHFAKEGDIVGYRGLGSGRNYPVTATALQDTVVCFIDLPFFETTLHVNQQLMHALLQFFAGELQQAEQRMRNLVHMDVKGRVADTLLMLQYTFGKNKAGFINIVLTRQDMASYSGTTYETFFRTINDLIKEKIIKVSDKSIAILKQGRLEALTFSQ